VDCLERAYCTESENYSADAAHDRQQYTLRQKLPDQTRSASADRGAQGDLFSPECRTCRQQICAVRTGTEEYEKHSDLKQDESRTNFAYDRFIPRFHADRPVAAVLRIILSAKLVGIRSDTLFCLIERRAFLEPADHTEILIAPLRRRLL